MPARPAPGNVARGLAAGAAACRLGGAMAGHPFDLQGHRGARGLYPENTLAGFRAALALGVSTLETDVALTADDVAVACHDPHLNPDITRGPDGAFLAARGPAIRALRFADLARYDIGRIRPGSPYAWRFRAARGQEGLRIPRLAEVFALDGTMRFNSEIKTFPDRPELTAPPERMVEAVLSAAAEAGATARLVIQSFDWRNQRHAARLAPGVARAWLTSAATTREAARWWGGPTPGDFGGSIPRAVAAEGGGIWAPEWRTLDAALIAEAHALGLRVVPWTVNARAEMARLIRAGVDGLITDRPDRARAAMVAAGLPLPPARP